MRSHDLIRKALDDVGESVVIHPADYHGRGIDRPVETQSEAVLGELLAAATFVATLAYWGDEKTDRWWFDDLERLGWRPHENGLSALIGLARSPALVLCYAAGTAAVAAERWDLVLRLLTKPTVEDTTGSRRGSLVTILTPESCGVAGGSARLCRFVGGFMHRWLGLGAGLAVDAWERFEYLCMLTAMTGTFLPWQPCMRSKVSEHPNRGPPRRSGSTAIST